MSEFKELIKSFARSREYIRGFFIYGFKTRDGFTDKSRRTYDNERRRIESWLWKYIHTNYTHKGLWTAAFLVLTRCTVYGKPKVLLPMI